MFDIGFLEIIVILIIALLVIGPERMPEVARKIGQFVGKTKRFIHSVKENSELTDTVREIQQSMNLEEEKRHLEEVSESLQNDFSHIQEDMGIDQEISRPTFGGEEAPSVTGSQYNRAPAQPMLPADKEKNAPTAPQPVQTAEPEAAQVATAQSEPAQPAVTDKKPSESQSS